MKYVVVDVLMWTAIRGSSELSNVKELEEFEGATITLTYLSVSAKMQLDATENSELPFYDSP